MRGPVARCGRLEPAVIRPVAATVLVLLAAACTEPAAKTASKGEVAAVPAAAAVHDDADCNLSTPLEPGIPGSPGHLIASKRNPNGDSELATLMRRFVDDLRDARALVEAGEKAPALFPVHRKMRCAWPSRIEERNARFDAFAIGYLTAVRTFDERPGRDTYNAIIDGCIVCHSQSCGGPIEFIGEMRWQ